MMGAMGRRMLVVRGIDLLAVLAGAVAAVMAWATSR